MHFPSLPNTLLLALALHHGVNAAASDDKKTKPLDPCTIAGTAGTFYDLRSLSITPTIEGDKVVKGRKTDSWHAKGWDYHSNFTLNICAPVVEELEDVEGIDSKHWGNVSAYYDSGSKTYSLGQQSDTLILRGRRLVLEYTNGSPCGSGKKNRKREASTRDDDDGYEAEVNGDEAEVKDDDAKGTSRRKSASISFHCDKDPLATTATATFVSVDPEECAYSFEVLSPAACVAAEPAKQGVGPGAVFAIIGVIAILVYFLGGVFYQRNVAHARGWRQLPNYSMWAGIGSFIKDIFIIATSSCAGFLPSRRGYSPLSISANGNSNGRGRNNRAEDENRLIDQLDEEWDD